MVNLSAVVLTKNEEANIKNCLESLKFCDEIVIIDGFSIDKTVAIAQRYTNLIYTKPLNGDFSSLRNFALTKTTGNWILFVDADEIVSPQLQKEILREVTKANNFTSGYYFKRTDIMWGQKVTHGEIGGVRLARLAQKNAGRWHRRVHEHWHIIGETKEFKHPLIHYPHQTISEFLIEINDRTTLHALANREEDKRSSLGKIIFYPTGKFIYGYITLAGFLDGIAGFVIAMIMSLHSFMSWSKLWFLQKK